MTSLIRTTIINIGKHWDSLLIVIIFILTICGISSDIIETMTKYVRKHNDEYLNTSIQDAASLMLPIGMAKGAADVVQGSTVNLEGGIVVANAGTTIQVGDMLEPVLEYLDVAWRILLLSIIFLTATKYILLGCGPIAVTLFAVSLGSYIVNRIAGCFLDEENWFRLSIRRMGGMFLLCALLFWIVLPLTLYSSSKLSDLTTAPLRDGLWKSFDEVGQVFNLDDFHKATGFKEKAKAIRDKSMEMVSFTGKATVDVGLSVAKLAVTKILDGIVFPFLSFVFLVWIVRGTLYPALGLGRRGLARKDIEQLIAWLASKKVGDRQEESRTVASSVTGIAPGS